MSIGKRFRVLNVTAVVLVIGLAVAISLAILNQRALNLAQNVRYESYLRANELRMSSEDLTRLARTYVVTGEGKYEKMYLEVLDVRNGRAARADGRTIALRTLMEQLGFTEQEFAKLKEAERNSNDLVNTETVAMHAVKGLYDDGSGKYTRTGEPDLEMARRIMHNEKYHSDKELIMAPIKEFERMLNERTQATVDNYVLSGNILLAIIGVLALSTAGAIFFISKSVKSVLINIVDNLKNVASRATSSTDSLVESATALSASSAEQAASIQETVSVLDEINAMVNKSVENARASSEIAKTNSGNAEKGKDAASDMVKSISEIEASNAQIIKQIEEGSAQFAEIVRIISEIGTKTKVINDIVFQTKLLSFNASVEAARAGEAGKGFAVVAEEVGNLAQMSGSSAKEISDMLESSSHKVSEIVNNMTTKIKALGEASHDKVAYGAETANRCGDSFGAVAASVGQVTEIMNSITRAADEQANGVREISQAMSQLNETTQTNSSISHRTASYADSLRKDTDVLQKLVLSIETEVLGGTRANAGGLSAPTTETPSIPAPAKAA